jgi:hypothetical protein
VGPTDHWIGVGIRNVSGLFDFTKDGWKLILVRGRRDGNVCHVAVRLGRGWVSSLCDCNEIFLESGLDSLILDLTAHINCNRIILF